MRFKRYERHEFQDTPRKRAALARKQQSERDALPLLADLVADQQPDADAVMAERASQWARSQDKWRAYRADEWRRARARLAQYPERERAALRAYWQRCGWPATGGYLLTMLHMFDTGRLPAVSDTLKADATA